MIRYQLRCNSDHNFEVWFNNSAAYGDQLAAGDLACPICGSSDVSKAVMAPNISPRTKAKGAIRPEQVPADSDAGAMGGAAGADEASLLPPPPSSSAPEGEAALPANASFAKHRELTEAMRKIRREVEANAEYVGPRFAEEARKIHENEIEPRGIYGEATIEEVQELNEDGIEFMPLPRLPEDNN